MNTTVDDLPDSENFDGRAAYAVVEDAFRPPGLAGVRTLYTLLWEHPVASLASAIEQTGVHGLDRFGRRHHFEAKSPEARVALEALAEEFRAAEQVRLSAFSLKGDADLPPPSRERLLCLCAFGWPEDALPELGAPSPQPMQRRASDQTKIENTLLRIVAVLAAAHKIDVAAPKAAQALEVFLQTHDDRPPSLNTLKGVVVRAAEVSQDREVSRKGADSATSDARGNFRLSPVK